ncbi:MAG: HNH endonuclease [Methylococcaceae bacterium]|jgi:hypothetical protein
MAAIKVLPSQEFLQECFNYNPYTGILTWRERPLSHFKTVSTMRKNNTQYANTEAGNLMSNGYLRVTISYTVYQVHRVIYKLVTGLEPPPELDHENNIKTDNRWSNLRTATVNQNRHNIRKPRDNTSGYKGVSTYKGRKGDSIKFAAAIVINKKRIFLGYFRDPKIAHEVYCEASKKYHGEFSNFG